MSSSKTLMMRDDEIVSVDVSEETSMVSLFFHDIILDITRNSNGGFDVNMITRFGNDPPSVAAFAGGVFDQVNEMHEARLQGLECVDVVNQYYGDLYGVPKSSFCGDVFLSKEEGDALFGEDRTAYDDFVDDKINV